MGDRFIKNYKTGEIRQIESGGWFKSSPSEIGNWHPYAPPAVEEPEQGVNPKDLVGAKKTDISLVPPSAILGMARALENGASKYGPYNWREEGKPVQIRTYLAAAMRHILEKLDGEEEASDSGVDHLYHAMAGLAVVVDAIQCGNFVDNRPSKGAASKMIQEFEEEKRSKEVSTSEVQG